MKIKLSKSQWEKIGKTDGWADNSQVKGANEDDNISKKRIVKVTFSDGDSLVTTINGTVPEIKQYYMPNGKRGPDQDYDLAKPNAVRHVVKVEFNPPGVSFA